MDRQPHGGSVVEHERAAAFIADTYGPMQQRPAGGGAQRNDEFRANQGAFAVEPPAAVVDFRNFRRLVDAPLAAGFKFKMFYALLSFTNHDT